MQTMLKCLVHSLIWCFCLGLVAACDNNSSPQAPEALPRAPQSQESPPGQATTASVGEAEVLSVPEGPDLLPRVVSVRIEPMPAFPGSVLRAYPLGEDPDGHLVVFDYQWLRNNQPISGAFQEELETVDFRKGDFVMVTVTPFNGREHGEPLTSSPVLLHNRPPVITSLPPVSMQDGKFSYQVQAEDPDGDRLIYSLEEPADGMEIDAESGRLEWRIPQDATGKKQIRIMASDGDAVAFQAFEISLNTQ
jgi:hypothetical protein